MNSETQMLFDFHKKYKHAVKQPFPIEYDSHLINVGKTLLTYSEALEEVLPNTIHQLSDIDTIRRLRAHLMIEELGETLIALGRGQMTRTFDGLLDLLYVTIGTAVTYDFPISEGFTEVHRSNMTKIKSDVRLRDKGAEYSPPNLSAVLAAHYEKVKQ